MRIFIYESITGGGAWSDPSGKLPEGSMLREGAAMIGALAADFLNIDGVEVLAMRDRRIGVLDLPGCRITDVASRREEQTAFASLLDQADYTLLIAPEIDHVLLDRCRQAEAQSCSLLSPSCQFIELTSDKHCAGQFLTATGIATPAARLLPCGQNLPEDFAYPAVIKPRYGAGSSGVRLLSDAQTADRTDLPSTPMRLESYCPGTPVSVSLLCGLNQVIALPASLQRLSDDGRFQYHGGRTPLESSLCQRARRLALATIEALPAARGYVGIDMILGENSTGGGDTVIEINPRMTTSYVGLRAIARFNLAAVMFQVAVGQVVERETELSYETQPVTFHSDGTIQGERRSVAV